MAQCLKLYIREQENDQITCKHEPNSNTYQSLTSGLENEN